MTFTQLQKLIRKALGELEIEVLAEEPEISEVDLKEVLHLAKTKILEEQGIEPKEFFDWEEGNKELGRAKSKAKKEELKAELNALEERIVSKIPPEKEIPPPQIINKTEIIKEIIKEKPTIIEKTYHTTEIKEKLNTEALNALQNDLNELQSAFTDLYDRFGQLKIPELPDLEAFRKVINKDSADIANNLWGDVPNFRMLGMGLRGDLDQLRSEFNAFSASENLWDRSALGVITPNTAGDSLDMGTGNITTTGLGTFGKTLSIPTFSGVISSENVHYIKATFGADSGGDVNLNNLYIANYAIDPSSDVNVNVNNGIYIEEMVSGYQIYSAGGDTYWGNGIHTFDGGTVLIIGAGSYLEAGAIHIEQLDNTNNSLFIAGYDPMESYVLRMRVDATGKFQVWGSYITNVEFNSLNLSGIGTLGAGAITGTSLKATGLTTGRVVFTTTAGLLTDSADLTFNGSTLTTEFLTVNGTISGIGSPIQFTPSITATANDQILTCLYVFPTWDDDSNTGVKHYAISANADIVTANDAGAQFVSNYSIRASKARFGQIAGGELAVDVNVDANDNIDDTSINAWRMVMGMNYNDNAYNFFAIQTNSDPSMWSGAVISPLNVLGNGNAIFDGNNGDFPPQSIDDGATVQIKGSYTAEVYQTIFHAYNANGADVSIDLDGNLTVVGEDIIATDAGKLIAKSAGDDKNVSIYHDDTNTKIDSSSGDIIVNQEVRASTSLYRRYYHLSSSSFAPGASGATWTPAGANNTSGWQLNASTELLEATVDIHSDWDAASDLKVEVYFALLDAGSNNDTVDIKMTAYYIGTGETAPKTQTVEVPTTTTGTQYKVYKATFTIDYDLLNNVVQVGDVMSLTFNLETDTSEIDNILFMHASFYYNTAHIGIESGDV